ncbi:hypothetical protein AD948_00315 [Acetobacter senegalensis]|uniref:Uncharacterized protein n=1 Tax=Acetobacter senegalensis TaxID=446692 RepID=A0A149U8T8_9PROT|nr:hypothetical protein [Acetobacter senegalensis]KXV61842.1 hypothetical protein AD948_00315 [Acetobacter senegalensis]
MDKHLVEIIKPGIYKNLNSYWAMHYCSILETLYEHKTIEHGFQRGYMENIDPTLANLAAKAGFAFFFAIKNSLQNFGLQSLLCHYLVSSEGRSIFKNIVEKISDLHNFDFLSETQEYGVFVSAKDFRSGERFIRENNPILLGWKDLHYNDAVEKVHYADLCILLKGIDRNFAILGEVEGNHGGDLLLNSFWSRKRSEYYSFGIGVRSHARNLTINPHEPLPPAIINGQWTRTEYGWKYVITIDSLHSIVRDFHDAIGTIQTLMTLGPRQRANYDPSLLPVLNLIKNKWDDHILDIIDELRSMLSFDKMATLRTNPLPAKVVPSIIT